MNLVSNSNSPTSWKTAFSNPDSHVRMTIGSPASFTTAFPSLGTPKSRFLGGADSKSRDSPPKVQKSSEVAKRGSVGTNAAGAGLSGLANDYHSVLLQKGLMLPQDKELNWSGKGQHVTFAGGEAVPVQLLAHLGASMTAVVEKVQCRRVVLARKTMRCTRNYTVTDALREVEHLHRLRHFHIIQLVGSYIQGRNFAILMYPAADCHLGTFLEDTADMATSESQLAEYSERKLFLASTLSCLISALAHIHAQTTKHMDIKPANILVRRVRALKLGFRVYIADFGLSRSFAANEHSQTDGPTARTPKFCAPEVFDFDYRGRSADIFSLGCVYLEILTVYKGRHPHDFAAWRRGEGHDDSFHANLKRVREWVSREIRDEGSVLGGLVDVVEMMVQRVPETRPTADDIQRVLASQYHVPKEFLRRTCCTRDPESYVAYEKT